MDSVALDDWLYAPPREIPEIEVVHVNEIMRRRQRSRSSVGVDQSGAGQRCRLMPTHFWLTVSESATHPLQNSVVPLAAIGHRIVVDCTGKFTTEATLKPYLEHGVAKVVVSASDKKRCVEYCCGR